jgi:hypothetical protein
VLDLLESHGRKAEREMAEQAVSEGSDAVPDIAEIADPEEVVTDRAEP